MLCLSPGSLAQTFTPAVCLRGLVLANSDLSPLNPRGKPRPSKCHLFFSTRDQAPHASSSPWSREIRTSFIEERLRTGPKTSVVILWSSRAVRKPRVPGVRGDSGFLPTGRGVFQYFNYRSVTGICQVSVSPVPVSLPNKLTPKTVASWFPCFPSGLGPALSILSIWDPLAPCPPSSPKTPLGALELWAPRQTVLTPRLGFHVDRERHRVLSHHFHFVLTAAGVLRTLEMRHPELREVR